MAIIAPRLAGGWAEAWAEDVVEEATIDVLRSWRGCHALSEAELQSWIARIAKRQLAGLWRSELPRVDATAPLIDGTDTTELDAPLSGDLARRAAGLEHALEAMGSAEHALLWARVVLSATWPEIGEELGTSASAAKRRYQRLSERLRKTAETWLSDESRDSSDRT